MSSTITAVNSDKTLDDVSKLFITPSFRWWVYIIAFALVIYSYVLDPIRFSGIKGSFGLSYKYEYFIIMCLTLFFYLFVFLGLWLTIPFTARLPYLWYIPIVIIIFAIITQISLDSPIITTDNKDETLNPPPGYFQPRSIRKLIYYAILVLDVIVFIQGLIYAGISTQFKSTVLHQFFLNRFGGTSPENTLNFATEWLGVAGILLDIYWIYGVETYSPCQYKLPASWGI